MEVDTNATSGQKSKPAAAAVPAQTTSSKPLVPMSRKERKVSMFGSDDSSDENESSKSPSSKANNPPMVQDSAVKVEVKAETEEPVAPSNKNDASDEVKTPPVVRKEKEVDRRRRSSSSHQSNKSANENDSDGKESVKSRKSTSSKKGRRVSGASVGSEKRLDTAESLFDQLTVNVGGQEVPAKSDKVSPAAASMKSPASSLLKVPSTSTKSPILKSPTLKSPGVAAAAPLKSPLASASTVPGKNESCVLQQPASCKCTLKTVHNSKLHKVQSCTNSEFIWH